MPRASLIALLLLLFLVPATAQGKSDVRLRGTVATKDPAEHLVAVDARRASFALHVPGSLAAIRVGQRVELRGATLRARGNGSRVLARGVTIASSGPLASPAASQPAKAGDESQDDELEIEGTLTSLSPPTVVAGARTASCSPRAGMSLSGFAVGDRVEMTCDLVGSVWTVRKLEREDVDDEQANAAADDEDHQGDGHGPGSGDDHGEDDG